MTEQEKYNLKERAYQWVDGLIERNCAIAMVIGIHCETFELSVGMADTPEVNKRLADILRAAADLIDEGRTEGF